MKKSWLFVLHSSSNNYKQVNYHNIAFITVIARYKNWAIEFAIFLVRELIPKFNYLRFEFLMKVIVAQRSGQVRVFNVHIQTQSKLL